jgi:uncharacterized protein YodC (DUF2158 family)
MTSFKTGDVVRLKSGSVPMTVSGIAKEAYMGTQVGDVFCQWQDSKQEIKNATFHPDMLEHDRD